ncbi:MAG: hypothetical protein ACR2NP_03875 [Pirellulaceae bacterium]
MGNSNKPRNGAELTRKLSMALSLAAAALMLMTQIGCGLNPFNRHRCPHRGYVYGDCGCAQGANYAPAQPVEMAPMDMAPIEAPVESQPVDAAYQAPEIPGYAAGWRAGQSFASRYGMTTPLGTADPLPAVLMEHNQNPEWVDGCRTGINEFVRNRPHQIQPAQSRANDVTETRNTTNLRAEPIVWPTTPTDDGAPAALLPESLSTPLSKSITLNSSTGRASDRDSIEAPECLTTPLCMDVHTRRDIVDELTIDRDSVLLRNRHVAPPAIEQQYPDTQREMIVEQTPGQSPVAIESQRGTMSSQELADRVERMFSGSRPAMTPEPLVEWEEIGQLNPLTENPGDLMTQSEPPLDTTPETTTPETAPSETDDTETAETSSVETEAATPESTFQPEQQAEVVTQPEIEAEIEAGDSTGSQPEVVAEQARPVVPMERSVLSDLHPFSQNRSPGTGTNSRISPLRHVPDETAAPISSPQSDLILSATTQPAQGGMTPSERLLMPSTQSSPMRNSQYRLPAAQSTPATTQPAAPSGADPGQKIRRNQIPVFRDNQSQRTEPAMRRPGDADQLQRQGIELNPQTSLTADPVPPLQDGTPAQNASWQDGKSHARILQGESGSLLIPRDAVEMLPAVGPQLDDLIKGEDRSLPISNTPALSPRQANPNLDELFR